MTTEKKDSKVVKNRRRGMDKPIRKDGNGIKQGPAGV